MDVLSRKLITVYLLPLGFGIASIIGSAPTALSLPPPEDIPEEILRTEIVEVARSPIDGEPLSASEYAALQNQLQDLNDQGIVSSELEELIFLLQLRRGLKPFIPFLP